MPLLLYLSVILGLAHLLSRNRGAAPNLGGAAGRAGPAAVPSAAPGPADFSWDSLPPPEYKMLARVRGYELPRPDGARSLCTACNDSLGRDWSGPSAPITDRHVRRLLAQLAQRGAIEVWRTEDPRVPTGRLIRSVSSSAARTRPTQQMELDLRDLRARRLEPSEIERAAPVARAVAPATPIPAPSPIPAPVPPPPAPWPAQPRPVSDGRIKMSGGTSGRTSSDVCSGRSTRDPYPDSTSTARAIPGAGGSAGAGGPVPEELKGLRVPRRFLTTYGAERVIRGIRVINASYPGQEQGKIRSFPALLQRALQEDWDPPPMRREEERSSLPKEKDLPPPDEVQRIMASYWQRQGQVADG